MKEQKEPYVSQQDRPSTELDPDTPISQLRVRDLGAILGRPWFPTKIPHPKFEVKTEIKEFFDKPFPEKAPEVSLGTTNPGSTLDGLVALTSGLVAKVDRLADQLAALEKRREK